MARLLLLLFLPLLCAATPEISGWQGPQSITVSAGGILEAEGKGRIESAPVAVKPSARYRFKADSFSTERGIFHMGVDVYDRRMKLLSLPDAYRTAESNWNVARGERNFTLPLHVNFDTGKEAAFARFWIEAGKDRKFRLSKIVLEEADHHPAPPDDPPVEAPYTRDSLMLPGPDGYLYPNFTAAGLDTPWRLPKTVFRVEEFGAAAGDGKDDSAAIMKAIEAAANAGGGVVAFGGGVYSIGRRIVIPHDNIVLRGKGADKTRLDFGLPDNRVGIFVSGREAALCFQVVFPGRRVKELRLRAEGLGAETIRPEKFDRAPYGRYTFRPGARFHKPGVHTLEAEIEYEDGRIERAAEPFMTHEMPPGEATGSYIVFTGRYRPFLRNPFHPADRGAREITVKDSEGIRPGDIVSLRKHLTEESRAYSGGRVPGWNAIDFYVKVAAVEGKRLTLAQPLRLGYAEEETPFLYRVDPVRNSGIENLAIRHTGDIQDELGLGSVFFHTAFNCRASGLRIERPGTSGVFGVFLKNCEFSDCRILRPRAMSKNGNLAYAGLSRGWDCLIDRFETERMRHAPLFNWCSSGNVVTGSVFRESDAQYHSGWCHDNLIEDCRILDGPPVPGGSYGWALFAVPYHDNGHGAIGPRNVLYNCDAVSRAGAVYMGGPNRDWRIMYNRFTVGNGPGVLERIGSDHTHIVGNTFMLKSAAPMVFLEGLDSTGAVIKDNLLCGGDGRTVAGAGTPRVFSGNRVLPRRSDAPRPEPPAPSLWKYQLERFQ